MREVNLIVLLDHWQSFIGALIGAFIPVCVSFLLFWWQSRNNFRHNLNSLDVFIASAIYELSNTREELMALTERLRKMEGGIKEMDSNQYFVGNTNFPTMKLDYGTHFLENRTKSLYLANKLLFCHVIIKNIDTALCDMQFELRRAIAQNHERLIASKDMDLKPETQQKLLISEIEGIIDLLDRVLIKGNIPVAIDALVATRTYLSIYERSPFFVRHRYEGIFRWDLRDSRGNFVVENKLAHQIEEAQVEVKKMMEEVLD